MGAFGCIRACCPSRIDLAMEDACDAPEMGSPVTREDGAREEDGDGGARRRATERSEYDARERDDATANEVRRSFNDSLSALKRRKRVERAVRSVEVDSTPKRGEARREAAREAKGATSFATYENVCDFSPLGNPESALAKFLATSNDVAQSVSEALWEHQLAGVALANRLVMHHQAVVLPSLRPFVIAVAACVNSLRSSVAKSAIALVSVMATYLGSAVSAELGCVLPSLLKKSSEMNFLSVEADGAIRDLLAVVHPHIAIRTMMPFASERRFRLRIAFALAFCMESCAEADVFRGRAGRASLESTLSIVDECTRGGDVETKQSARRVLARVYELTTEGEWKRALKRFPDLDQIVRRFY